MPARMPTSRCTCRTPIARGCSRRRDTSSRAARSSSKKDSSVARRQDGVCMCGRRSTRRSSAISSGTSISMRPCRSTTIPSVRVADALAAVMNMRGVIIDDTFAEAFGMSAARVVVTAVNARWARAAAQKLTGLCDVDHRLQVRSGNRARPDSGGDARRPARHLGALLRDGTESVSASALSSVSGTQC